MSSSTSVPHGPCGACRFLRRKCVPGCIFAPYFDSEQGAANFAGVHKVFGAANVTKLLLQIPAHKRGEAVLTIIYEAQARLRDPVHGCVAHIFALQHQVANLQAELSCMHAQLATLELPSPLPPPALNVPMLPPFSMSGLPSASRLPVNLDFSALFDQQMQPSWNLQQQQIELQLQLQLQQVELQQSHGAGSSGGGDLSAVKREFPDEPNVGGSPLA